MSRLAGNGVVWSAVHIATGIRVAVKIILPKDDDKEAMFWIHREIEVMKPVRGGLGQSAAKAASNCICHTFSRGRQTLMCHSRPVLSFDTPTLSGSTIFSMTTRS